jgi:hypothetical protein
MLLQLLRQQKSKIIAQHCVKRSSRNLFTSATCLEAPKREVAGKFSTDLDKTELEKEHRVYSGI